MFDVTDPVERKHAMAKHEVTPVQLDWKAVLTGDENGFRALLQTVVQEVLEAEMTAALQAEKNESGRRAGSDIARAITTASW
jgi:transposase-like protein